MKKIINKVYNTVNEYDVEILAVLMTSIFMITFAYVIIYTIETAF